MTGVDATSIEQRARTAEPGALLFVGLVVALTLLRLVGQHFSIVDLDVDEAQYWDWSRELAFGYFSKPPLIAWVNAGTGLVCGDGIACIRAPAPLLYLGTSLLIYATARVLYGATAAFWAGLTVAVAIGVSFSARIMTTDVILLFFWALTLLAYVKLLRGGGIGWAALLAVSLGFGLLDKYAMAYFVASIVLAAFVSRDARALLRRPALWVAIVVGVAMLAPNIVWNVEHGFATAKATADYTRGGGSHPDVAAAISFVASQFAVVGPITFAVLLVLFARFFAHDLSDDDRVMLVFSAPPLVVVTANALFSGHANANWAAPAMISAFIVTAAWLVRGRWWRLLFVSVGIGIIVQVVLLVADPFADRITVPGIRHADVFRSVLGWRALGGKAEALATQEKAGAVAAEGRAEVSTLTYYLRDDPRPVLVWSAHKRPTNHFESMHPLEAASPEPILLISSCSDPARLKQYFSSVTDVSDFKIPTGPTSARDYSAFLLAGSLGPLAPLAACP